MTGVVPDVLAQRKVAIRVVMYAATSTRRGFERFPLKEGGGELGCNCYTTADGDVVERV